jgi:hypothetical protein
LVTVVVTAIMTAADKRRERREKRNAAALVTYHKIAKIFSITRQIRNHLTEQYAFAAKTPDVPRALNFRGMNRLSGPIEFSNDEMWAMGRYGANELFNRIQGLDWSFNSLLDNMDEYRRDRAVAMDKLKPVEAKGVVGTVELDRQEMVLLTLQFNTLDDLIDQVYPITLIMLNDAFDCMTLLVQARKRPLGKKQIVVLRDPVTDKKKKIRAVDAPKNNWWIRRQARIAAEKVVDD